MIAALSSALVATWGTFIAAFFRGDLIPGHVYRRVVKWLETQTTQNARNADSMAALAKAHEDERHEYARKLSELTVDNARLKLRVGDLERQAARDAPHG